MTIGLNSNSVPFRIVRSRRRSLALVVSEDGTIEARAPVFLPVSEIERFIGQKRSWIDRKRKEILSKPRLPERKYTEGEIFYFLGKKVPLRFDTKAKKISVGASLVVPARQKQSASRVIEKFYRSEARRILSLKSESLARQLGVSYKILRINGAARRWGSCSSLGSISFSYRLIMAPMECVDLVVAHELCHINVPNHSPAYYRSLASVMPDHRERERLLGRVTPLCKVFSAKKTDED